jgi:hypothetical protein
VTLHPPEHAGLTLTTHACWASACGAPWLAGGGAPGAEIPA